jgi:hypothetical protein
VVQSLGTPWGLFRHYWVVFKLLITAFATIILLIYLGTFRHMAAVAADADVPLAVVPMFRERFWLSLALTIPTVDWGHMLPQARGPASQGNDLSSKPRPALIAPR